MNTLWREYSGAVVTDEVVGRGIELSKIYRALRRDRSQVIFITGEGGIGKTFLLRAVLGQIRKGSWDLGSVRVSSDLIDFYDTSIHALEGLTRAIRDTLGGEGFETYTETLEDFVEKKYDLQGQTQAINELRQTLGETFLENLAAIAASSDHVVIAFDTAERLFENEFLSYAIEAREWLREVFLPRVEEMGNVSVLIAGRPSSRSFLNEIRGHLDSRTVRDIELGSLDVDAVREYIQVVGKHQDDQSEPQDLGDTRYAPESETRRTPLDYLNDERIAAIQAHTNGRPILLSLLIDYLVHSPRIHPHLFEIPERGEKALRDEIINDIVHFWQSKVRGLDEVIELLTWATKGVDAKLLARVEGGSFAEAQEKLENLRRLAFIKYRPATKEYFLHDEMQRLAERHIVPAGIYDPSIYDDIIGYYDPQIDILRKEIENQARLVVNVAQLLGAPGEHTDVSKSKRRARPEELAETLRQLRHAVSDVAYYRLLRGSERDSDEGVEYVWLSVQEAHWANDEEWMALLYSVVLEYSQQKGRDEQPNVRALTVLLPFYLQLLKESRYGDILAQIKDLKHTHSSILRAVERLWAVELDLLQANMEIYLGYAKATEVLDRLIEEVQGLPGESWHKNLLLAQAYNLRGYAYRQEGSYYRAVENYGQAITLWRQMEYGEEETTIRQFLQAQHANTLNNSSWAYSYVGKMGRAIRLAKDALEMRIRLGTFAPIAKSLNTLGRIHVRNDQPLIGQRLCAKALKIFSDFELQRGQGLAGVGFAEALRRSSLSPYLYTPDEQEALLDQSAQLGEQAAHDFKELNESGNYVEALIETGCAYREFARIQRENGLKTLEIKNKSEGYLRSAMKNASAANLEYSRIDAEIDLAWLYFYMGDYENAREEAEQAIDSMGECVQIGEEEIENEASDCTIWQPLLGKAHLLLGEIDAEKAEIAHKNEDTGSERDTILKSAGEHYTMALAYDRMYAEDFRDLRRAKDTIYRRVNAFGEQRMHHLLAGVRNAEREGVTGKLTLMRELLSEYFAQELS
jgi:tetratricopeptide (TPR) repeat protein